MKKIYTILAIFAFITFIASCKKSKVDPIVTPVNPCLSKTIVVSGTTTATSNATSATGTITASASGSTGFTYSTNGTTFQATGNFTGLAVGTYTVTAKDADGCTGTQTFSINIAACPTIAVSATPTTTVKCEANTGTLTLAGSGGTAPYTYSVNGGTFQSSGTFSALAFGSVSYVAKDANGCTGSGTANIAYGNAGANFTAVKALLVARCNSCHGGANASGGFNFTDDCMLVSKAARVNQRAVVQGDMPQGGPLSVAEKAIITAWITAGGKFNN